MKSKADLINIVYEATTLSKSSIEQAVDVFLSTLINQLKQGNEVRIYELGTFKFATRKAHTGRNPSTGETIHVAEKIVPQLKFNKTISRKLNEGK